MKACCSYQPADRPSFSEVANSLERVLADFSTAEAADAEVQRVIV